MDQPSVEMVSKLRSFFKEVMTSVVFCLGVALKGVRLLWTTCFSNKFSLFQLLQTMLALYGLIIQKNKLEDFQALQA